MDPQGPAALQARRWRSEGRAADAAAVTRLAKRPTATWFADSAEIAARVREASSKAAKAGRSALLVAYHVPGRDCGSYSAGGSGSPSAYRTWVRGFARGIGARRATVILEPDAIAQAVVESCLSDAAKAERYALLADAVQNARRAAQRRGLHRRRQPRLRPAGRPASSGRCAPPASRRPTASRST